MQVFFYCLKGGKKMARLIACSVCGRVHMNNYMCNIKKKRDREKKEDRVDSDIYFSSQWRKLRADVLEDYQNVCLYTFYTEGRAVVANCVHHIIEIMEDDTLAYEVSNLIPLSNDKHKLIHELYREDKKKIQNELREMKERWEKGDRNIPMGIKYPPI